MQPTVMNRSGHRALLRSKLQPRFAPRITVITVRANTVARAVTMPPMLGVPCLAKCAWGPLS